MYVDTSLSLSPACPPVRPLLAFCGFCLCLCQTPCSYVWLADIVFSSREMQSRLCNIDKLGDRLLYLFNCQEENTVVVIPELSKSTHVLTAIYIYIFLHFLFCLNHRLKTVNSWGGWTWKCFLLDSFNPQSALLYTKFNLTCIFCCAMSGFSYYFWLVSA